MAPNELDLRVSVALLARVVFPHPHDRTPMLALERQATCVEDSCRAVQVRAQPFGGAVRLHEVEALRGLIGHFDFDSERSRSEQDFRLLIRSSDWTAVRQFCLRHLVNPDGAMLEAEPFRELAEEFGDALEFKLERHHCLCRPTGLMVQDGPMPTGNRRAAGQSTVRIYRIFEVQITDASLVMALLANSNRYSDQDLQGVALENAARGGPGRANAVLALSLQTVMDHYLGTPLQRRYAPAMVAGHRLDASVPTVLEGVDLPEYERC